MRYILKRVCALSLVLAMILSFTACGKKVGDIKLDSGVNAIYIDEDGAVSYGVTEKFADKDYDKDALEKYPKLKETLELMDGILTDQKMAELNYQVEEEGRDEAEVAEEFLKTSGLL